MCHENTKTRVNTWTYSGSNGLTIVDPSLHFKSNFVHQQNIVRIDANRIKPIPRTAMLGWNLPALPSQCPCFLQEFIAACSSNAEFTCSSLGWWLQKFSNEFAFEDALPMQPLESKKTLVGGAKRKQHKTKGVCLARKLSTKLVEDSRQSQLSSARNTKTSVLGSLLQPAVSPGIFLMQQDCHDMPWWTHKKQS